MPGLAYALLLTAVFAAPAPVRAQAVESEGASPQAAWEARRILAEMLKDMPPDVAQRSARGRIRIFSKTATLTDFPQFARFKGRVVEGERAEDKRGVTDYECNEAQEGAEVWFGLHQFVDGQECLARHLRKGHPEFYAFLARIYGSPRDIRPEKP